MARSKSNVGRRNIAPRVRIHDIAASTGVSLTTVSAVLTGNRPVASATKARVEQAIAELGYRGNANARALVHGSTQTLALLIPPIATAISVTQMEFVANIVEAASQKDYDVLVSIAGEEDEAFTRLIAEQRVDGYLLLEVFLEDRRVDRLRKLGVPFVSIGRSSDTVTSSWVDIDFHWVIDSFVRHLADLGHEHLVLFNSSRELYEKGYGPARRGQEGFLTACENRGIKGKVVYCESNEDASYKEADALLSAKNGPTGFVVANECDIAGIYRAIGEKGWRVPDDVSVTAIFDRWPSSPTLTPRPATADRAVVAMARAAVDILLTQLETPSGSPGSALIRPLIDTRGSTGPAPMSSGMKRGRTAEGPAVAVSL